MAQGGVNVDQCTRYAEAAMCGQMDFYARQIAAISSEKQKAKVFRNKTSSQVESILVRLSEEIRKSIIGKYYRDSPGTRIEDVVLTQSSDDNRAGASAFINKAFDYSQVVCFVLPIQFNKFSGHNQILPQAKLVFNEPLPENCFVFNGKPYSVRSCFQVWTTRETRIPDLRIRQSPKTRHPDFEMYQYNCTEEAAKFFDKNEYPWDFAVPRQGFKDYRMRETNPQALDRRVQWIFFKAKNKKVLSRLKNLDFEALSRKNSTIPGFGKADVVEEYERLYPTPATNALIQTQLNLYPSSLPALRVSGCSLGDRLGRRHQRLRDRDRGDGETDGTILALDFCVIVEKRNRSMKCR